MQERPRRWALGLTIAALAVVITPALLFAHARLVRSTPAANANLAAPPSGLSLWFSEAPEVKFTSLQLLDSAGTAMSLGDITHVNGDATGVTAKIASVLGRGRYTVVWRTAAADGHATNGEFSFVVAESPATVSTTPSNPPASQQTSRLQTSAGPTNVVVQTAHATNYTTAMRWAELVGLLALIGCIFFRLLVLPRAGWTEALVDDSADRARRLAHATLVLFAVATLTRLVGQSDLIPNASLARIDAVLTTARDTRWGHGWMIGAGGAIVAFITLRFCRHGLFGWMATGVAVVMMCFGEALTGHSVAIPNRQALAIAADVSHVLGAGGWIGGLLAVVLCGLRSLSKLSDVERPSAGSKLVRSYHQTAIECVALVLMSALVAILLRLNAVSDLWLSAYGRTLLLKIGIVVIVLGFGFFHWRTAVLPEWTLESRGRFRRSAMAELLAGALIVAVTAVLVGTALP